MRRVALILALIVAACSGATGPKGQGLDPTVLVTNQTSTDTVFFTWRDGQGIVGSDSVLPLAAACEKFVAQADSAYFEAHVHTASGATYNYVQPWFDPLSRPAWTMVHRAGASLAVTDVSPTEPC